jgi:LysR family hydrogen peroxide-inducible transcriptional activator
MEIHQLEYLIAVAEEGGFTRAAEKLLIAQPSLSQQIKKLEQEVGQPLFDRLPRGVVLTEAGQRLLEYARRVLNEISDAKKRVRDVGDHVAGSVTVGAIPTIAPFVLPAAVRGCLQRWPGVTFTVIEDVTAHLFARLAHGELDVAIISSSEGFPGIHVETVASEPLYLVVARGHRLAKRRRVSWADIREEPFLLLHDMHCLAGQVLQFCKQQPIKPCVVAWGEQLNTIAAMVSAGLGVSIVPEMFRAADRGSGRVYLPFAPPRPTRELCIARSAFRYRTNAARAFVEHVKSLLASAR